MIVGGFARLRLAFSARGPLMRCHGTSASLAVTAERTSSDFVTRPRQKHEGTIEDVFTSFTNPGPALRPRFSLLKKVLFKEQLVESWREVLQELSSTTADVTEKGISNIPRIDFASIVNGMSEKELNAIKHAGVLIVKGGVSQEEALAWKQSIRNYVTTNANLVKGSPADKIVFYELYNSKAQVAARTHHALVSVQRELCSLWHASDPATPVSLTTPITYFDRLRIRDPGPSAFALDCHIDGGSLERWEDPGYQACFARILEGRWKEHDPYDASPRLNAKQDLYHAPNQCSVFRPWQGWTSLSSTGPGEGTLRVLPFLKLSTAYIILRPFFHLKPSAERRASANGVIPLGFDEWEVDLESTEFPGSAMGKAQILSPQTHPHLKLEHTMISIPRVEPGDQVYWHCDLVHAVERQHLGASDSSVLYIPAVPMTAQNAIYLRNQLSHFRKGLPAPDFPGGEGESRFSGRATEEDLFTRDARRVFGIEPYDIPEYATPGAAEVLNFARQIQVQNAD